MTNDPLYSSSEMTGSMFDVAVFSPLVLRCGHCYVNCTTTGQSTLFSPVTYFKSVASVTCGSLVVNTIDKWIFHTSTVGHLCAI
jgi:hypothetical protein